MMGFSESTERNDLFFAKWRATTLWCMSVVLTVNTISTGVQTDHRAYVREMTGKSECLFSLFAFDNYMASGDYAQTQVRADTLKSLGYDGMGTRGATLTEQAEIFEKAGLKLHSTYLGLDLDSDQKYDANLMEAIRQLKGRDTLLWMTITSQKYKPASAEGDAVAVAALRELADAAYDSGLKIALYPHANLYVETLADSVRIAKKVNRRNVGGSFNLCHWLKVEGDIDYRPVLKEALPYLFLVSTCGAETGDTQSMGWDKLIQTLDKGSFDNYTFLKYLKKLGYTGPVGLQGYRIQGDPKENLAASMRAWRSFQERYQQEHEYLTGNENE